jgi:hypothetical protein
MKKIIALIAALVVTSGLLFAGDFYNGDFQLHGGVGFNSTTIPDLSTSDAIKATQFNGGLESWHMFRPITLLGVGFMAGANIGFGSTKQEMTFVDEPGNQSGLSLTGNFEVGPAVSLYLFELLRIGFHFSYNTGFNIDTPYSYSSGSDYLKYQILGTYSGFSTGLQFKAFPEGKVSAVAGWKLVKGLTNSEEVSLTSSDAFFDAGTKTLYYDYSFTQNILYAGVSFNW